MHTPRLTLAMSTILVLCGWHPPAQAQCETRLSLASGEAGDSFGTSVSVQGNRMVVGAIEGASKNGFAVVFRYDGTQWQEAQTLVASDGLPGDQFGWSCSLHDDVIAVGAPSSPELGLNFVGSVYVFRHDGTAWREEQKLVDPQGFVGDRTGYSSAIHGDWLAVGSPWDSHGGRPAQGTVFLYHFDGSTWQLDEKIIAGDGTTGALFGFSCDLESGVFVAGAIGDNNSTGAAYLYRHDGASWQLEQKLLGPTSAAGFGRDCAIRGDLALVGCPGVDSGPGPASGAAFVYRYDGTLWQLEDQLLASDGAASEYFGHRCDLSDDAAVVATRPQSQAGAAYAFELASGTWQEQEKLQPNGLQLGDQFGASCAISGRTIAVGADWETVQGNAQQGTTYVYPALSLIASPTVAAANDTATLTADLGRPGTLGVLTAVAVNGTPTFYHLRFDTFDAAARLRLSATVPPGLSGNEVDFQSFGTGPCAGVAASNRSSISFR